MDRSFSGPYFILSTGPILDTTAAVVPGPALQLPVELQNQLPLGFVAGRDGEA